MLLTPLLCALLALPAPADPQRVLHAVPEDASLFVAAYELDGLRARWAENAWGAWLAGEALAPLRAEALAKAEDALAELDPGLDFAALVASIHGSACYYQALGHVAADPFRMGMLVEPGAPREAFDALLAQGIERLRAASLAEGTSEQQGCTLRFFVLPGEAPEADASATEPLEAESDAPAPDAPAPEGASTPEPAVHYVVLGEQDGLVALAFGDHKAGLIEEVLGALARWRSAEGGLRASTALAAARASQPLHGSLEAFVATGALLQRGSLHDEAREILGVVESLGTEWIHATAEVGAGERLDASVALSAADDSYWLPVLAGLRPPPLELAGAVPPQAKTAALFGFDLAAALQSLRELLARTDPERLAQLEAGLAQAKALSGLDVEQDVLGALGHGLVQASLVLPREETLALLPGGARGQDEELEEALVRSSPFGQVWVLALRDRARFERVLEKVLQLSGAAGDVSEETLDGTTVRRLATGPLPLRWVVRDEAALFSLSPSALSAALAQLPLGRAASLADDARIGAVLREHARASLLSVGRTADLLRGNLELLDAVDALPLRRDELLGDEELGERFQGTLCGGLEGEGHVVRLFFSAR